MIQTFEQEVARLVDIKLCPESNSVQAVEAATAALRRLAAKSDEKDQDVIEDAIRIRVGLAHGAGS